jgi:hypothetical protein
MRGYIVLTPPTLNIKKELRPLKEIAGKRDKRPHEMLLDEVKGAIEQLLIRAHCGDQMAIVTLVTAIHHSVEALEHLAKHSPQKVKLAAEVFPRWPVLLSLNRQEIQHVKEYLKSLGVGTKARTPTRPGQRLDPRHLWTHIADEAYAICRRCKHVVPELEWLCQGVKGECKILRYWRTEAKVMYYLLPDGKVVIIADWQKKCKRLSEPITEANFGDWWKAVRMCVLQYWMNPEGNYLEALRVFGNEKQKDWWRRNRALDAIKNTFRSLVNLQE